MQRLKILKKYIELDTLLQTVRNVEMHYLVGMFQVGVSSVVDLGKVFPHWIRATGKLNTLNA